MRKTKQKNKVDRAEMHGKTELYSPWEMEITNSRINPTKASRTHSVLFSNFDRYMGISNMKREVIEAAAYLSTRSVQVGVKRLQKKQDIVSFLRQEKCCNLNKTKQNQTYQG